MAGAVDGRQESPQLVVDPADHPVVGGGNLGQVPVGEVVPAVAAPVLVHEPRLAEAGLHGERSGHVGPVVHGVPRFLDHERRVRREQRHPHRPRAVVGSLLEPPDRRLHGGLVAVESGLVALAPEPEAPVERMVLVNRDPHVAPRPRGLDEVATEVGAGLRDARGEDVAPVARHRHVVAGVLQAAQQVGLPGLEQAVEGAMAGGVRIPAGHDRHPTGATHGMLRPGRVEAGAPPGEGVEVGGLRHRVPETPEGVRPELVRSEQQQVRTAHRANGRAAERQVRSRTREGSRSATVAEPTSAIVRSMPDLINSST